MNDEVDLALSSSEDLLEELVRRYDHVIFCAMKVQGDDMPYIIHRRQEGSTLVCIGLAQTLSSNLASEHEDAAEEPDGDDD